MRSILHVMRTCIVQTLDARIVCDGDWGVAEGLVFDNFEVKEFDWLKVYKRTQEKAHGSDFGFTHDPTTLISTVVDIKNKELWIYDEHYEKVCSLMRYIKCM